MVVSRRGPAGRFAAREARLASRSSTRNSEREPRTVSARRNVAVGPGGGGFEHPAFVYRTLEGFASESGPFIAEGVERG
jgi:hypothetical protein